MNTQNGFMKSKVGMVIGGLVALFVGYMIWGNIKYADQPMDGGAKAQSGAAYGAGQSNFKNESDGTITWSVEVKTVDAKTLRPVAGSVQGAVITVEARDALKKVPYTATVGEDGWARWNTRTPEVETEMYLMDIKGDLAWSATDKEFWSTRSILAWKKVE